MSKKLVKRKRLGKKEFAADYIRNSIVFYGEKPTKEDISRTYNIVKDFGKKKRAKRNSEPEMSKEEFVETIVRNNQFWDEPPTEEDINREWDLIVIRRKYNEVKGDEAKAAYLEKMEQEMKLRYPRGATPKTEDAKGD